MEKVTKDELISYLESLHNDAKCALNYTNDYELLIAIILSAQTTDESVNKVTPILFSKYKNIEDLSNADQSEVESIIHSIGLSKNKSSNIIKCAQKLNEDGYKNIPDSFDYLITLPGVGRKTANVFLAEYYNKNTLGIDTHILRISKRLQISKEDSDVLKVEKDLKEFIGDYPTKKFHHMMIVFGRNECTAKKPMCKDCKIKEKCITGHNE